MVRRKRHLRIAVLAAAVAALASCASAPKPAPAGTSGQTGVPSTATSPQSGEVARAATGKTDVGALQNYLDTAHEKIDQGQISEGVLNYVTILSEIARAGAVSAEAKEFGKSAEEELNRIGAALSLSAGGEWMDGDKNQVTASTLVVGTPKSLSPSVTLTYSFSGARALVADAPIVFEFLKGSGTLITPVNTDEYGKANTTVTSLDNVNAENIIRATVSYRVKGYTYTFKGASRDFAFMPPVRKATILVMERAAMDGGAYVSAEPVILDRAYNVLKRLDFQFTPYNGKLLGDQYMKVFGGDNASIRALGLEEGVSYLVMVLSDGYYVKQVELNGKKYELFKSKTNGTTRVIRVADGAILYSGTVQSVDGQGNTGEKAAIDGFRTTAEKMAQKLESDLGEISKSLVGR